MKTMGRKLWLLIFVVYGILFVLIYNYIPSYLDLPRWSGGFFYLCGFVLAVDIASRAIPGRKRIFSFIWESSIRDRSLLLIFTIAIVILNLVEGYFLKNIPAIIGLIISLSNLWILKISINLFGSLEFKQVFNQNVRFW